MGIVKFYNPEIESRMSSYGLLISFGLYISLIFAIPALALPPKNPTTIAALHNVLECFEPKPYHPQASWVECGQVLKDMIDRPDWEESKKYGPGLRSNPVVWLGKQCSVQLMSMTDSNEDFLALDDIHDVAIDILTECVQFQHGGRKMIGAKGLFVIVHGLAMSLSAPQQLHNH